MWNTFIFSGKIHPKEGGVTIEKELKLFHCKRIRKEKTNIHTIADPFLIFSDDRFYLFVEEMRSYGKGKIKCWSSIDGKEWEDEGIVLDESFHLSYPYVFQGPDEVYYMIPETASANAVYLYRSDNFPYEWKQQNVLLKGDYCDTNILYHGGLFWLFASKDYDELHVFYAKSLSSTFQPIPNNPQVKSSKYGRNGGGVIPIGDKLYRIAQDCSNGYGKRISLLEISSINTEGYKENLINDNIFPYSFWWNTKGCHHLSICNHGQTQFLATDGRSKNLWINKVIGGFFRLF